jgi:hypothetical protein
MTQEVAQSVPVSITVDRIFEMLSGALAYAVKNGGNAAKSVAWDVNHYFTEEIGHYRSSAIAIEARSDATGTGAAEGESADPQGIAQGGAA